jgi:polysaccharide biosynthesis transport protein
MDIAADKYGGEGKLSDIVINVRDVLQRRWKTLVAITVLVTAAAVALIFLMTPQFEATARVRIDPSRSPLAKADAQKDDTLSPEAIETEVSVITSLDIARQVVDKLHLESDPELGKGIKSSDGAASGTPRDVQLATALLRHVDVSREKLTYLIGITVKSVDAAKAARIANAFADLYIQTKINTASGSAQTQADWFRQRLEKLQVEVRDADQRVARYRAAAGIVGTGENGSQSNGSIADQRVGPLSNQLATAQSEAAAARAQLTAAEAQASRGGLDSVSEVRSSPVVAELRRQRADLLRNIGEVQARYGDKHPESLRVRGQLETVDKQIREEGDRVLGSLRANASAADAQVSSLSKSMASLEGERGRETEAAVQADSLSREAAAKRTEYERLSQMLLESTQAAQNSIAQAEIVGRAEPASHPSSPNKPLLLALGIFLGLAAGAATIAVQEVMVSTLRTSNDVEELLGLPMLAAIPKVSSENSPADLLISKPTSIYSEAFRIIRTSVVAKRGDKPPIKIVAVTSALPSEGKTSCALAFARSLAIGDAKTILVECDVRRAAVNKLVNVPMGSQPGIVEVLHGEVSMPDAIRPSDVANLDQLLVKEPYFSSEDLFGSNNMRELLSYLSQRYDQIVLDLPPLVGLADGRTLATLADAVLMVVKWDSTPSKAAETAVGWLQADGANVLGVLLSMVSTSSQALGSYYYSKQYSKYYQSA